MKQGNPPGNHTFLFYMHFYNKSSFLTSIWCFLIVLKYSSDFWPKYASERIWNYLKKWILEPMRTKFEETSEIGHVRHVPKAPSEAETLQKIRAAFCQHAHMYIFCKTNHFRQKSVIPHHKYKLFWGPNPAAQQISQAQQGDKPYRKQEHLHLNTTFLR